MQILSGCSPVQESANDFTLVDGSILNASTAFAVSYTARNTGDDTIAWEVHAGNLPDLSDSVVIQASATIASDAVGSYSVTFPPFKYYGIKIKSNAADTPGEATISGVAKG